MIKRFEQNHFGVNTYLIYNQTGECVLVDVASQNDLERQAITDFIHHNGLKPVHLLITHPHIDHICGAVWASEQFNLPLEMHSEASRMLKVAEQSSAALLGFDCGDISTLKQAFIHENEPVTYGDSVLIPIDTCGHCAGSFSYYNKEEGFVLTGDALFYDSVGRTDLPTSDHELLINNIRTKLLTLPSQTIVYPGHGEHTSICFECNNNPFL